MQLPSNPVNRFYLDAGENSYLKSGDTTGNEPNPNPSTDNGSTRELVVTSGNDYIGLDGEIINYPLNSIVIKKTDANTSEILAGAAFEIRKVSGISQGAAVQ
ncbi:MAG: hypothetical protein LBU94_03045 [Clostridiales bacterium]|jgi:RNase P/RNase MRP subunit p29|nr:hypothetical protein [Clostridiales bacterium]